MDWIRRFFRGGASDALVTEWEDEPDPPTEPPLAALPYRRTAHVPVVEDGPIGAGSGFGGVPHLADGVEHPSCPHCHLPMPLIAQVDLDAQPVSVIAGDGLLQLLYCTREQGRGACDVELEGWAAFSTAHCVRIVPSGPGGAPSTTETPFEPVRVTHWTTADDFPDWQELGSLGADPGEPLDVVEPFPLAGEKLGGWPRWVQGIEYPSCPTCGSTMGLVLQVDSRVNLAYDWGDMGTGHVTQCPKHPDVLAFAWACS